MTRCDWCDTLHNLPFGAKCPECPKGLCWPAEPIPTNGTLEP